MAETDDLELQQYQRQYWEDDVPVADVRKNVLRKFIYIGAGLFMLLILGGAFIKFPDEVSLPFVLKSEVPEDIYRFPYPVYIEANYNSPGKSVKKGASLIRITSPEIVALINNYRQAEAALNNYRLHKTRSVADTRAMMRLQSEQNEHLIKEIAQQQAALQSTWISNEKRLKFELEDANKKLDQNQALYRTRAISALELKTYEVAQMRAADALITATESHHKDANALREEAARYSLQSRSLNAEEDRNSSDARTDSSTLINNLALMQNAIQHSFGDFEIDNGSLTLLSNADGMISFVFNGEREVPASAILMKLTRSDKGVYASAISPPSLIGKLKKGQIAFLKVATFPAYEWGAAKGHIDYLSLAPDEKGVFNIKIHLDDPRLLANHLQSGMDGTVAVQLDERTFFQYFFRNFKKAAATLTGNN